MLLNYGVEEDSWESLEQQRDQTSQSRGNKPIFIGGIDAEAESLILWPSDAKSWLTEKDPDAGKDWGQEEKRRIEDEIAGWYHQLNGHEFEWAPGDGEGQGGHRVGHDWATELTELNWTD